MSRQSGSTSRPAGLSRARARWRSGEWLSVTNARELVRTQIAKEREEIEQARKPSKRSWR